MSARLLLEVALRILGVWFIASAIITLTTTMSLYLSVLSGGFGASGDHTTWLYASGLSVVVHSAVGLGLIFCAPIVAVRFYPEQVDTRESPSRVGPGDLYQIACFVLGVFLFIKAVEPAGRIVDAGVQGPQFVTGSDVFTMTVYISAGILMVFGARRIGELLSSMRYDPESIPNQQFSIKLLLILTGLIAVLFGVVRWFTQ